MANSEWLCSVVKLVRSNWVVLFADGCTNRPVPFAGGSNVYGGRKRVEGVFFSFILQ